MFGRATCIGRAIHAHDKQRFCNGFHICTVDVKGELVENVRDETHHDDDTAVVPISEVVVIYEAIGGKPCTVLETTEDTVGERNLSRLRR